MITICKTVTSLTDGKMILELRGKSTDEKPIDKCGDYAMSNGSTFYEIDTGEVYLYDSDAPTWVKQ